MIALEYTGPPTPRVQEADTLRLTARAIDLHGDSLPVQIVWQVLMLDTNPVGLTVDSLTGLVSGNTPGGPWQIQGRVDDLRTNPGIGVTVTPAPDSVAGVAPVRDTVPAGQAMSAVLAVTVFDLTTTAGQTATLGGIPVIFALTDPAPGATGAATVALAVQGLVGDDPRQVTVPTATGTGRAGITVQRVGTGQPDSIAIDAVALTARGDTVPGSPVRFIVVFLN